MAAAGPHIAAKEVIAYEESGQPVRIVYDTWTPRPHFIVVQCLPKQDATDSEFQATYEIISRFLRANPQFDKNAILSFHRGKWYQQYTSKWHAHLCVPDQPYMEKARTQITEIANNKEWRGANRVEDGMTNWYRRKLADYAKYKTECVQKRIPDHTLVENVVLSTFDSSSNEFKLVWTSPAPRIGIVSQSPTTSSLASLYTFMTNVRVAAEKTLARHDKNFANFGCHLCLYVRDQPGTTVTCRPDRVLTENGGFDENPNIVGYIQMDECQYAQWLPRNLRQIWLDQFKKRRTLCSNIIPTNVNLLIYQFCIITIDDFNWK